MKKAFLLILILTLSSLHAAAPLFHAVIGKKWLETFGTEYTPEQKRAFMLGTLFPDIRYVAKIPRKSTHEDGVDFKRVMETEDPFLKGMRLHVFVDNTRVNFLAQAKILDHLSDYEGDRILFLKVLEDVFLFSLYDPSDFVQLLQHIDPEEVNRVPLEVVQHWHETHANYFKGAGLSAMFPQRIVNDIERGVEKYAQIPLFKNYLLDILKEFDTIFLMQVNMKDKMTQVATFAGGCFWCVQHDFDSLPGVLSTTVGYTGGIPPNPSYEEVYQGDTGHVEAIQVVYDPHKIEYRALVEAFWHMIEPSRAEGQFCDIGTQYRPVIFYHTPAQKEAAEVSKRNLENAGVPVAVLILPAMPFYSAEEYHQKYYQKSKERYTSYRRHSGRS